MSKAKNNLVLILQSQIEELHKGIVQMDEQSLIKQVAKHKVLYNLTAKSNEAQLLYSYIALSQYYVTNQYYEAAIKNLLAGREIKQTGDIDYLLGVSYFHMNKIEMAYKSFEGALKRQWIQPSKEHQKSNKLESISYLQKIIYERVKRKPERTEQMKQKLIELSYDKIKITQKSNELNNQQFSENYYYALAMADLSIIYEKFNEYDKALEKISTAISMFEYCGQNFIKLIEFNFSLAKIHECIGNQAESKNALKTAIQIIQDKVDEGEVNQHLRKVQNEIYYMLIRKNIGL